MVDGRPIAVEARFHRAGGAASWNDAV